MHQIKKSNVDLELLVIGSAWIKFGKRDDPSDGALDDALLRWLEKLIEMVLMI